jgi:hypothetical protein
MSKKETAATPNLEDGLKAPAGEANTAGPFTESAPASQPTEAQPALPGTTPEKLPREPRSEREITHDFRMAKFNGKVLKIAEDWKNDRDFQITLSVPSHQRIGLYGLENFNGDEALSFRVLPVQTKFNDKAPEEFGDKVPQLGVAMIERLEKKSCEGYEGWQKLTPRQLLDKIHDVIQELPYVNEAYVPNKATGEGVDPELFVDEKYLIDLANFVFFLWHNMRVGRAK